MVEVPKAYKTNIVIDGVEKEMTHYELFSYATNEGWSVIDSKIDDNEAYNYYIFAYDTTFAGCYELTDIYFTGTEEEWNNITGSSELVGQCEYYNSTFKVHFES